MDVSARVDAAFRHVEPDRVPLWGIVHNRAVYEHVLGPERVPDAAGLPLPDKLARHAEVYAALGIELTRAQLWPPDRGRGADGETVWRERTVTAATLAAHAPPLPAAAELDAERDVRLRQIAANAPHTVFAPTIRGCFCATFEALGLEEFSFACADAPAEVDRVMWLHAERGRALAGRYAARPDCRYVAICDDLAFKTGTIFPPAWMRAHWLPKLRHVLAPLHAAGVRTIFHSDGRMDALIPDLIEAGVAAVNPLEPLAGMDLAALKRDFGRDITLIGGVDCSQLLPFAAPDRVRDEVRRLLDIGAPGGGFVIGDSSSILPCTPLANVLAFYETVLAAGA